MLTERPSHKTRICTCCLTRKPVDQFRRRYRSQSARHSWCRQCVNQKARDRRQKQREREFGKLTTRLRNSNSAGQMVQIIKEVSDDLGGIPALIDEWGRMLKSKEVTPTQKARMLDTFMHILRVAESSGQSLSLSDTSNENLKKSTKGT